MSGFHRFIAPTYSGGLRVGDDYLNNLLTGTPAPIGAIRTAGPNAGSYFVNFGEIALAEAVNRALAALGQNTDYLDDQVVSIQAQLNAVRTITAGSTLHSPSTDGTVIINPAASLNLQLPDPATVKGVKTLLINGTGGMSTTNKATLVRFGTEKISNVAADYILDQPYGRWLILSDGTNWHTCFMLA